MGLDKIIKKPRVIGAWSLFVGIEIVKNHGDFGSYFWGDSWHISENDFASAPADFGNFEIVFNVTLVRTNEN